VVVRRVAAGNFAQQQGDTAVSDDRIREPWTAPRVEMKSHCSKQQEAKTADK
jgi:hypothetical protein